MDAKMPPMRAACRGKNSGFTLVEIMIALGIFMLVIFSIYSTWSAVLRGSKTGLDAAATAQRSRVAIHAIEDSLTCATMFSANLAYYSFLADSDATGEFSTLTFTSHLPMSFPGAGLFGDQGIRRISFFVEPDPVLRRRLVMMQTPLLEEASDHPQGYPLVLARGVTEFLIEYWDTRQSEWTTDAPPTNQLPSLVRIKLGISSTIDRRVPPEEVIRIVRIASTSVSPSMQAPLLPPTIPPPPPPAGGLLPRPGGGGVLGPGGGQPPGVITPRGFDLRLLPGVVSPQPGGASVQRRLWLKAGGEVS